MRSFNDAESTLGNFTQSTSHPCKQCISMAVAKTQFQHVPSSWTKRALRKKTIGCVQVWSKQIETWTRADSEPNLTNIVPSSSKKEAMAAMQIRRTSEQMVAKNVSFLVAGVLDYIRQWPTSIYALESALSIKISLYMWYWIYCA